MGLEGFESLGVKDEPVHDRQDPIIAAFGNSAELNKR